jgi:hypothetical protein
VVRSRQLTHHDRRRVSAVYSAQAALWLCLAACSGDKNSAAASPAAGRLKAKTVSDGSIAADTAERTLAIAAGAAPYRVDDADSPSGTIAGDVTSELALPRDTTVTPDADSTGCAPFQDNTFPDTRRRTTSPADIHSIGNAVVWLVGVTHGPGDSSPRRLGIRLQHCQLEPRVQSAAVGATINASTSDDLIADLKFVLVGAERAARAEVNFTDPGQVVPTSAALASPGLIEIRDAHHAWIRGYIAVSPHPFVAITEADGKFTFEGVPAGSYQLVVWHERLGARVMPVKVSSGGTLELHVNLTGQ